MQHYLFDFDGTLVDSMSTYINLIYYILEEYGIPQDPEIIKIVTPLGFEGAAKYLISIGVPATVEKIVEKMHAAAKEAYATRVPAKPHVVEVLRELKSRGAQLNVLTASPHTTLDPCLKRLGIFDLFTNVWSCEDFGTTKADPDIYRQAAEKMGVSVQDVLFLDDNLNADQTAKRAGMRVFGVYDSSSEAYTEQIKAATDGYITDFCELL